MSYSYNCFEAFLWAIVHASNCRMSNGPASNCPDPNEKSKKLIGNERKIITQLGSDDEDVCIALYVSSSTQVRSQAWRYRMIEKSKGFQRMWSAFWRYVFRWCYGTNIKCNYLFLRVRVNFFHDFLSRMIWPFSLTGIFCLYVISTSDEIFYRCFFRVSEISPIGSPPLPKVLLAKSGKPVSSRLSREGFPNLADPLANT
jgi:hypothetical protein